MAAFRFNGLTKHGRLAFNRGVAYGFKDPDAIPYCKGMNWGEETEEEPEIVIAAADFEVDKDTVFADGPLKGQRVLGG